MRRIIFTVAGLLLAASAQPALAWGNLGHEVVATIAYGRLTSAAKAKVDALLAADTDTLTKPDFASRATWADIYREKHAETAQWHFVDIELDNPSLATACFNFPTLIAGQVASAGPAQDCVVDKIQEFTAELSDPSTPQAEQILALKFLIHFVGDVHQPLHSSDHMDRGGNCINLVKSPDYTSTNLHSYWDTGVFKSLGTSPTVIAAQLNKTITSGKAKAWGAGDAKAWALESFDQAQSIAYKLPATPICGDTTKVALSGPYEATALKTAELQLEKAGVRLAFVLNQTFKAAR